MHRSTPPSLPEEETSGDAPQEGIAAATLIVFRHGAPGEPPEILMTVRSREMVFAGGMAVFPGGRVDPADRILAQELLERGDLARLEEGMDADELAHRIAAIRETLEETGLALGLDGDIDAAAARAARTMLHQSGKLATVLDHFGWRIDASQIVPFARWFPKNERIPRLFDTRFYIADVGTGAVDIAADLSENSRLFWTSAAGALEAAGRGEIKLIFPTRRNLERLARFASFAEAREEALRLTLRTITPFVEERGGRLHLCIRDDQGYPVTSEPLDSAARA